MLKIDIKFTLFTIWALKFNILNIWKGPSYSDTFEASPNAVDFWEISSSDTREKCLPIQALTQCDIPKQFSKAVVECLPDSSVTKTRARVKYCRYSILRSSEYYYLFGSCKRLCGMLVGGQARLRLRLHNLHSQSLQFQARMENIALTSPSWFQRQCSRRKKTWLQGLLYDLWYYHAILYYDFCSWSWFFHHSQNKMQSPTTRKAMNYSTMPSMTYCQRYFTKPDLSVVARPVSTLWMINWKYLDQLHLIFFIYEFYWNIKSYFESNSTQSVIKNIKVSMKELREHLKLSVIHDFGLVL